MENACGIKDYTGIRKYRDTLRRKVLLLALGFELDQLGPATSGTLQSAGSMVNVLIDSEVPPADFESPSESLGCKKVALDT